MGRGRVVTSPEEPPRLLAIVAEYVDGAVDGWTWAVEDVRAGSLVEAGQAVGTLVADFHRALASTARAATADEVAGWRAGALADLERALEVTEGAAHDVLVRHADAVRGAFDEIADVVRCCACTATCMWVRCCARARRRTTTG